MDPTAALLWEAARPAVRPDAVRQTIESGADMARACEAARRHGLGPMLWRALQAAGGVDTGDAALAELQRETDLWRARAQILGREAIALSVEPLMELGIEPVVWKGPALATRYPEPGLRPMSDIDVIVPVDRHPDAIAALQRAGWRSVASHKRQYDTALLHPSAPGFPVEVHFSLDAWRHRPNRLRSEELWARRRPIDLWGVAAYGLAPDDEVVAVAAHAGKPWHGFTRLLWATDLAVLADDADWTAVKERAEIYDCRTVVAVGLLLAARVGASPPWWLTELPAQGARRRAIDEVLDADWPIEMETLNLQARLRYALTDRPSRAGVLFVGEIIDAPRGQRLHQTKVSMRLARRVAHHWPFGKL
jgi:hypothetical protein